MDGCHNDGVKTNNAISNLRWDTRQNNLADTRRHGTFGAGEQSGTAVLTWEDVRTLRAMHKSGQYTYKALAIRFGVDREHVSKIVQCLVWKPEFDPLLNGRRGPISERDQVLIADAITRNFGNDKLNGDHFVIDLINACDAGGQRIARLEKEVQELRKLSKT